MRRLDREVTDLSDILAILDKCQVMRLGLCADNVPYIVPMHFSLEVDGEAVSIYFHCANEGKKLDIIAKNDHACFEADILDRIVEADDPCNWSSEYQSVIGEGKISAVADNAQKIRALALLMKRSGFLGEPEFSERALNAVTVLKIAVTSVTGKRRVKDKRREADTNAGNKAVYAD